jgi:hypothetical protein
MRLLYLSGRSVAEIARQLGPVWALMLDEAVLGVRQL